MLQEGEPIWVESLMTEQEIAECRRKYSTYNYSFRPLADFTTSEFRWRWRMGAGLYPQEIKLMNSRIDELLEKAGIKRNW